VQAEETWESEASDETADRREAHSEARSIAYNSLPTDRPTFGMLMETDVACCVRISLGLAVRAGDRCMRSTTGHDEQQRQQEAQARG